MREHYGDEYSCIGITVGNGIVTNVSLAKDGKAEYIVLSYEPSNVVCKKLYASFGFEEHFKEYIKEDDEINALLKL